MASSFSDKNILGTVNFQRKYFYANASDAKERDTMRNCLFFFKIDFTFRQNAKDDGEWRFEYVAKYFE